MGTSSPGPIWLWFTAWSLQGTGVLIVEALDVADPTTRFLLIGAAAALPLLGLYEVLRRRTQPERSQTT